MAQVAARELALAAIAAKLTTDLAGVAVERGRRSMITAEETLPAVVLLMGGHEEQEGDDNGTILLRCQATVEGYARGTDDADLEAQLNDLHARCAASLMGAEIAYGSVGDALWIVGLGMVPEAALIGASEEPLGGFTWSISFDIRAPYSGGPYTTA